MQAAARPRAGNKTQQMAPIDGVWRQPHGRLRRQWKITPILLASLVIMLGTSTVLYMKYRHAASSNPLTQQQQLTRQLSRLIEIPAEQPIITTVLDSSKLTNQALATEAHDGDRLFIFPRAGRLILYRPSDKKVVDMLTIQNHPAATATNSTPKVYSR